MVDDLVNNKEFEVPVIEVKIKFKKFKKEYNQYMVKFPKKLVKIFNIDSNSILKFVVSPLKENEKYPIFKLELIKNDKNKKQE